MPNEASVSYSLGPRLRRLDLEGLPYWHRLLVLGLELRPTKCKIMRPKTRWARHDNSRRIGLEAWLIRLLCSNFCTPR